MYHNHLIGAIFTMTQVLSHDELVDLHQRISKRLADDGFHPKHNGPSSRGYGGHQMGHPHHQHQHQHHHHRSGGGRDFNNSNNFMQDRRRHDFRDGNDAAEAPRYNDRGRRDGRSAGGGPGGRRGGGRFRGADIPQPLSQRNNNNNNSNGNEDERRRGGPGGNGNAGHEDEKPREEENGERRPNNRRNRRRPKNDAEKE